MTVQKQGVVLKRLDPSILDTLFVISLGMQAAFSIRALLLVMLSVLVVRSGESIEEKKYEAYLLVKWIGWIWAVYAAFLFCKLVCGVEFVPEIEIWLPIVCVWFTNIVAAVHFLKLKLQTRLVPS